MPYRGAELSEPSDQKRFQGDLGMVLAPKNPFNAPLKGSPPSRAR
jgi:hypothetical protein